MHSGVQGYLLKDVEPEDLVHATRAAVHGHATPHVSVAAGLVRGDHRDDDSLAGLSKREPDVLRLIARGMSSNGIASDRRPYREGETRPSTGAAALHARSRTGTYETNCWDTSVRAGQIWPERLGSGLTPRVLARQLRS
jgi:hypothetical protein